MNHQQIFRIQRRGAVQRGDHFRFEALAFLRMKLIIAGVKLAQFNPELGVAGGLAARFVQYFERLAGLTAFLVNRRQIAVTHEQVGRLFYRSLIGLDGEVRFSRLGVRQPQPGQHLPRSARRTSRFGQQVNRFVNLFVL